ncbi:MAG: hypothetical protein GWO00_03105, partial [Gemmatimonadetes bacterium]|nr:hypothetical protein [Gemmatimonadota bacterium]NIT85911.1 hypothetical protein [Gemmatimonadota bacterium]NIU29737.1 hypothetical protein [Gemmatimonadota bacterium]NIV60145.1 hypothetical protein [Gemmatimonadota bacterium]NIW62802.1 hypothetical protein [Gemmatimonadota bacterium]
EPAGEDGTYFQTFQVRTGSRLTAPGTLAISPDSGDEGNPRELSQGEWRPFGFSGSGSAEAPLVYAGSGIANSGGHQEEIPDVEGRVMVVESGTPEMEEGSL